MPIRVHWSTPLGALILGGFRFIPAYWLGFFLLVLAHELGHAFVVRRVGGKVLTVDVMAMGGQCTWTGEVTALQRACIAWGGIWAQALLFGAAMAVQWLQGPPTTYATLLFMRVFTTSNLWMMAFNLLPLPPLDGAEAWPLVPLLVKRMRERRRQKRRSNAHALTAKELSRRDALDRELDEAPPEVKQVVDALFAEVRKKE